jgi:hypothetical protein
LLVAAVYGVFEVYGVENISANFPGILKRADGNAAQPDIEKSIRQVVALATTSGKKMNFLMSA